MEHVFDEQWIRQKQFKVAMENEVIHIPSNGIDHKVIDAQLPGFITGATGDDKKQFILDIGCGDGYAMQKMVDMEYENVQGITLHNQDHLVCKGKNWCRCNQNITNRT